MGRLVIVSNRVPPPRERTQLAGGLAVALREALNGREALWFGWSGRKGGGERGASPHLASVGKLSFATVDLPEAAYRGYYQGFSNATLWPMLHWRSGLVEFDRDSFAAYLEVNETFARMLQPLLRADDAIWVHDYHLIPLGSALRRLGVRNRIGFFLHVPFPPPAMFDTLPQADALLRDFAAYDLVGLQTPQDVRHLNEALAPLGVGTNVQAFPIGIDPDAFRASAERAAAGPEGQRLTESLGDRALILGVDRMDYTKGLPHRVRGFARLLKRFPEHRGKVTMLQVAPISRGDVAQYRTLRRELDELAGRINGEYTEFDWTPLRYITRAIARDTLAGFQRMARVGLITPLRDGMNLVAKEYVAAQNPEEPGALVLSRFAGAASELEGALLVNPQDPDETAEALHEALTMQPEERRQRWQSMSRAVWANTAASWARGFLKQLESQAARAA